MLLVWFWWGVGVWTGFCVIVAVGGAVPLGIWLTVCCVDRRFSVVSGCVGPRRSTSPQLEEVDYEEGEEIDQPVISFTSPKSDSAMMHYVSAKKKQQDEAAKRLLARINDTLMNLIEVR